MKSVKNEAFEVFDLLSEQEQILVLELIKRLAPDDIATADDVAAHIAAMDEYRRGETVDHESINWN
jgi:hypothetical protein